MNPTIDPEAKIEIVPETVASTQQPFGYEKDRITETNPVTEVLPEQVGLGILSSVSALLFPIIVGILLSNIRTDVDAAEAVGFQSYAIGSLVLFLVLIFVVPVTTIFSIITGYLAFKRSQKIGRWIAVGSGIITAIGIVLLILFVGALQVAPTTPAA